MTFLRVMSFNVFLTTLPEDEIEYPSDVWANRADLNVRTIRRYAPDIIGFQELDAGHRATYADPFADYGSITAAPDGGDVAAIFWRADRFEALAPSHRKEYVRWITEAKKPETRAKRVGEAVAMIAEGKART